MNYLPLFKLYYRNFVFICIHRVYGYIWLKLWVVGSVYSGFLVGTTIFTTTVKRDIFTMSKKNKVRKPHKKIIQPVLQATPVIPLQLPPFPLFFLLSSTTLSLLSPFSPSTSMTSKNQKQVGRPTTSQEKMLITCIVVLILILYSLS
jgi:hypothetical protein